MISYKFIETDEHNFVKITKDELEKLLVDISIESFNDGYKNGYSDAISSGYSDAVSSYKSYYKDLPSTGEGLLNKYRIYIGDDPNSMYGSLTNGDRRTITSDKTWYNINM